MSLAMTKSTKQLAKELGFLRKRSLNASPQVCKKKKQSKTNQPFAYLIVIDFESTCWDKNKSCPQEIIEFPAVLLNTATGVVESEFHVYLQPSEKPYLSDFCKQLTGITQEQVDNGIPLSLCLRKFSSWLRKLHTEKGIECSSEKNSSREGAKVAAFVTWSDWDLGVCLFYEAKRKQILKPSALNRWIDLRAAYRKFYSRKPDGLNGALKDLGIGFEGREHSGLDDSRNTAKLAWRMICDGCILNITKALKMGATGVVERTYFPPSTQKAVNQGHQSTASPASKATVSDVRLSGIKTPFTIKPDKEKTSFEVPSLCHAGLSVRNTCSNVPSEDIPRKMLGMKEADCHKNVSSNLVPNPNHCKKRQSKIPMACQNKGNTNSGREYNHKNAVDSEVFSNTIDWTSRNHVPPQIPVRAPKNRFQTEHATSKTTILPNSTCPKSSPSTIPKPLQPIKSDHLSSFSCPNVSFCSESMESEHSRLEKHSSTVTMVAKKYCFVENSSSHLKELVHQKEASCTSDAHLSHRHSASQASWSVTPVCSVVASSVTCIPSAKAFVKTFTSSDGASSKMFASSTVVSSKVSTPTNTKVIKPFSPVSPNVMPYQKSPSSVSSSVSTKASSTSRLFCSFKTPASVLPLRTRMKATPPLCACGRRSRRRVVQAQGPNTGRSFYSCCTSHLPDLNGKRAGCGFFQWEYPMS